MSLVDDVSGEQVERLAVLFCDISQVDSAVSPESEIALWRANYFRAASELATEYGGQATKTAAGGWIATFTSTVDALVCAQILSSLIGWQSDGPSLSGGLSAGDVTRTRLGVGGGPVQDAIALWRQAQPRQVLVADPLKVVLAPETALSFAPAARQEFAPAQPGAIPGQAPAVIIGSVMEGPSGGPRSLGGYPRFGRRWDFTKPVDGDHVAAVPSLRLWVNGSDPGSPAIAPTTAAPTSAAPSGAPGLLTVLGWVKLEAGDPPVSRAILRGSQARAVLSMLALRRGPVHKDELAELLWPESLPEHWEGALRGVVTKVRRFLEAGGLPARETLLGEGGFYELRLPANVSTDRDLATALLTSAETALADSRPDTASALARQAIVILARHLLACPDNTWFDQVRAELANQHLTALELRSRAALAAGSLEEAKRAATEAVAIDRYRESSYRLLMEAHAAAGSRGEALRTYERCRRTLAEELGVGPAAQTQALYIHLLG